MPFEQKTSPAEIAELIEFAKIYLLQIDIDALGELSKQFREQASRQDTLIVFSASPSQLDKNKILHSQAQAISYLHQFLGELRSIQLLKNSLTQTESLYDEIMKQFV